MDKREFKEALMLYGAELSAWPEELNLEAKALIKADNEFSVELRALIEEEGEFEILLGARSFEEPDDYLAGRIIAFAKESAGEPAQGLIGWLFAEFFTPRALVALALTLVIGFMAGYMAPKAVVDPSGQFVADDEMILEESFSSLFMEGDIFE